MDHGTAGRQDQKRQLPNAGHAQRPARHRVRDYLTGRLKIALATTADGQGEWTVQDQDPSLQPRKHLGQSLALIDGRPAVAYTHDTQGVLFAYDSGRPNSGFWPAVLIGREGVTGTGTPSLAQVAGRPAVVYADGVGIRFVRAR